jgi:PAS domain S-box-containing protein
MTDPSPTRHIDPERALRAVVEGTASETGEAFYRALTQNLARALDTHGAWVTEYDEPTDSLKALAFWMGDRFVEHFEYPVSGTACEVVIRERRLIHLPHSELQRYPDKDPLFASVVSYLGSPMLDADGRVLGHVAVVDTRDMSEDQQMVPLFEIFAARAVAEMRRLRLAAELAERQEKLGALVDGAMDAIVEMDAGLRVTLLNAAAHRLFGAAATGAVGAPMERLLGPVAGRRIGALAEELGGRSGAERHLWIPGGFEAQPEGRRPFPFEATLSRFEVRGRSYFTLILRDVDERLEAERRIGRLSAEAEYLREEIEADHGFREIVGGSAALRAALQGVAQVAVTDATVLITGETGTGKELFARAIHDRSGRREHPLIKVNCAAIPATLIESEFFGHERGAFTGATQRREGRFALADGGTMFLDEVGELPLELQGKLLRVLQEGEFEPVGGSRTRKVDVRVIAATNRDLDEMVRRGGFRQDLYYRLSVFPLRLPPLRERGDDVVAIATAILGKLARDMGVKAPALSASDLAVLRSYAWPGNVRELRNVIERALITCTGAWLSLERVLPTAVPAPSPAADAQAPAGQVVLSERQMRQLERDNLEAALRQCGWRVGGADGAAELLGVSASTLKSRIRALGLERPTPQV